MEPIAVIDFETTGMSPGHSCRATEIAAVIVEDGRIVARYQNLMNSGAYVPPFIESLTGISNAMLRKAPPAAEVAEFVGRTPLVAHNASFDQKFWDAELGLIQRQRPDVLVLDLMLPGEDGLSLCRRLRAGGVQLPIVMLTARDEPSDRIVGLELGADDYIGKPFEHHAQLRGFLAGAQETLHQRREQAGCGERCGQPAALP